MYPDGICGCGSTGLYAKRRRGEWGSPKTLHSCATKPRRHCWRIRSLAKQFLYPYCDWHRFFTDGMDAGRPHLLLTGSPHVLFSAGPVQVVLNFLAPMARTRSTSTRVVVVETRRLHQQRSWPCPVRSLWLSNGQLDTLPRQRRQHHAIAVRTAALAMRERQRNSGLAVPRSLKRAANSFPGSNSTSQTKSGIEPALNRGWRTARAAVNAHPIRMAITMRFQLEAGFMPSHYAPPINCC